MTDNKIARMLGLLEEVWRLDPELRLGQIISWEGRQVHPMDLFYVPDDELEKRLQARLEVEKMIKRT